MPPNNQLTPPEQDPFYIEVPFPPHFRTTCELLENLEKAWKIFKQVSIDPVFRCPSDDPLVNENVKNSIFMESGSDAFADICTKWATNEDLTFDIPQFFFDKLQIYVKKQCKALLAALQREDDTTIIDVTLQKTKKYWVIINYLEEYFIYFESVQNHPIHDTEHDLDMSKMRFMMSLTYKDEVFSLIGVRLRRIALDSLERKRLGDNSTSHNVKLFKRLIDLISISKEFTDTEWDFFLRESCFEVLIRKERFLKSKCLCHFVKEVALRVYEVEKFGVGSTTLFAFRNMIFPMAQDFFFADESRILHLIGAEAKVALKKLCDTFGYEQELMKKIANIIEKFMREHVVFKLIGYIRHNPEPFRKFSYFFFIWVKTAVLSIENLEQKGYNRYVVDALTEPYRPIISEYKQLFFLCLQVYFCSRMTKRLQDVMFFGKSADEELEAGVALLWSFYRTPDVDHFLGTLRNRLLKSVPRQDFSRMHVEYLLSAFRAYFPYLSKLSELKGFMKLVINQEKNLADFSLNMSPWKQIPDPNPIPIQGVKAIPKVDWPQDCSAVIKLPSALEQAVVSYSCFFHFKHGDKNLEYNFSHDRVTVTTSLFSQGPEETDIHMTTHQMSVLDLFQEQDSLSVSQIMERIQYRNNNVETPMYPGAVPEIMLKLLHSLMGVQYPLLTKTPDSVLIYMEDFVSLNKQFVVRQAEITLPVP